MLLRCRLEPGVGMRGDSETTSFVTTDLYPLVCLALPHPGQQGDKGLTVKETQGGRGSPQQKCACIGVPQHQTAVGR